MKDLTNIPERFHILFTTDWNNGNESKMGTLQRSDLSVLYLEYNKWDIQQKLYKEEINVNETIVGFDGL